MGLRKEGAFTLVHSRPPSEGPPQALPHKDTGHHQDGAQAAEDQAEWPDPGGPRLRQILHPPREKELQPEVYIAHKEGEEGPRQVCGLLVLLLEEGAGRVEEKTCREVRAIRLEQARTNPMDSD